MNVIETAIPGVLLIVPRVFTDHRGRFLETWNRKAYADAGIGTDFVQDNVSISSKHVLRGLHFQYPHGQDKLVQVLCGQVFDVAVDIRQGSPTFGRAVTCMLSQENHHQFFIPAGFAHGFCVLSDTAVFAYKCSDFYSPGCDRGLLWNDPDLAIDWPITAPILSEKDAKLPRLRDIPTYQLPSMKASDGL